MAVDVSPLPPPSPEHRRIAAERFERANQVIATGNYDYGIQLLLTCCKLDPANLLYRQALRRTQKAKYNNNLRGSRWAWLTTPRARARLKVAKRNRDYLKVLEHGEEILCKNPWDLGVQMDMAEAFEALGLLDLAVYTLDQARQKYEKDPTLNRALARLFEKRGNFSQAIFLWGLVREAVPDDVEAAHKAKDLAASETIARGQYDRVEVAANGELSLPAEPKAKPAASSASSTQLGLPERLTKELTPLLAKLENQPTDANLYLQIAGLYRRHGQLDRARELLQQGLGPTGSNFQILLEIMDLDLEPFRRDLAQTEERLRHKKAKATNANAAADSDDLDEPSFEELERIRQKLKKEINTRELEMFRLKADRYPHEPSHRLELGTRLYRADQIDEAIVELQQARKDARLAWRALMMLGLCFRKRNNWRLAQRNLEEALPLVPDTEEMARKEILYQLADGCAEAGDLAKAIDLGHELANLDFSFRDIGRRLDEWQDRLQQA